MAGASTVLSDSSLLSRLDRALLPVERFMALLSGIAAFSLMFLAAYSVGGRKFFDAPLAGYVDYIEVLMPLIAIMGISYVQREGGHIRMDILIGNLHGRLLWLLEFITVLLVLVLMIALVWGPGRISTGPSIVQGPCVRATARSISACRYGLRNWSSRSRSACWCCA